MTPEEEQLQQLALTDWAEFKKLLGIDAILGARVCMLRKKKASLNQISIKLNLTKHQVRTRCAKCG